uniref:Peptidase A1 domain-containing protein n=1 Tax=Bionectria ochroleuca TaxID=29856 RepID=A0A8H7MY56_BIOOC
MAPIGSWLTNLITLVTIGSGVNTREDNAVSLQEDGITQLDAILGFPEGPPPAHVKRSRLEDFEAVNEQSLYWGLEDDPIAEVHLRMKNETEGFVNTGFFDDLIESMSCPEQGKGDLVMKFSRDIDMDDVSTLWEWVRKAEDNRLVFMIADRGCGWNEGRVMYRVNDIDFLPDYTAVLKAKKIDWCKSLHKCQIRIRGKSIRPLNPLGFLSKRGEFWDSVKDTAKAVKDDVSEEIDEVTDKISENVDEAKEKVKEKAHEAKEKVTEMVKDGISKVAEGEHDKQFSIPFQMDFSGKGLGFKEASVELTTDGIRATTILSLGVKGKISKSLIEKSLPIFKVSPAGIAIPGVVTIGPTITVALKAATLDFLKENKTSAEGWDVDMESHPIEIDGFVEAKTYLSMSPSLGLEISLLETGFAAELSASLPYLAASVRGTQSLTCSACGNYSTGVSGSIDLGTSGAIGLKKKIAGTMTDLWSLSLYDATLPPMAPFCVGLVACSASNGTSNGTEPNKAVNTSTMALPRFQR